MRGKTAKKANKLTVYPSVTKPHFDRFSFQNMAVTLPGADPGFLLGGGAPLKNSVIICFAEH